MDDVVFHGTFHSPTRLDDPSPPGFILLHSLGGTRADWIGLCNRLSEEGFLSLSYDLRGHGESTIQADKAIDYKRYTQPDWSAMIQDVALAKKALLKAGADPDNIFIIGSDLGANIGYKYAHGDTTIQGIVLVSPGLEYKRIIIKEDMGDSASRRLPVLLIASEGDSYSAGSIKKLKDLAPAYAESRVYPGSAHGTDLVMVNPGVTADIVAWLKPIIK